MHPLSFSSTRMTNCHRKILITIRPVYRGLHSDVIPDISCTSSAHVGLPASVIMTRHRGLIWFCLISLRTMSIHLSRGLPRGLFPPTLIVVTSFATFLSPHLITWPCHEMRSYHEKRVWVTCVATIASLLNFSFLIVSFFLCLALNSF